jgi:hypothetical protein
VSAYRALVSFKQNSRIICDYDITWGIPPLALQILCNFYNQRYASHLTRRKGRYKIDKSGNKERKEQRK